MEEKDCKDANVPQNFSRIFAVRTICDILLFGPCCALDKHLLGFSANEWILIKIGIKKLAEQRLCCQHCAVILLLFQTLRHCLMELGVSTLHLSMAVVLARQEVSFYTARRDVPSLIRCVKLNQCSRYSTDLYRLMVHRV